jgi:hypothetical protein
VAKIVVNDAPEYVVSRMVREPLRWLTTAPLRPSCDSSPETTAKGVVIATDENAAS